MNNSWRCNELIIGHFEIMNICSWKQVDEHSWMFCFMNNSWTLKFMNVHHICNIMNCPIINSLHFHELFMNVLWINYETYSWNIHEHSRIHGIHEQFMNIEIHEWSSFLQHHELSNNKFIAPSWAIHEYFMNELWILFMKHSWTFWNSWNSWT
jgi:hypothetical protein